MEYIEAKIKTSLNNLLYTLEKANDKETLERDIERIFTHLKELQGGELYILELTDVLKLVEIDSYCQGILVGAKLISILSK